MENKCKKTDLKTVEKCELKAEQIKKALECCTRGRKSKDDRPCLDCPYNECNLVGGTGERQRTGTCQGWLMKDALSIITSQEQRIKNLEYTLEGVMHSVDKWLDGAELEQDEVNRAATMREKTLQIVERLTEENERLRAENKTLTYDYEELKSKIQEEEFTEEEIDFIDEYTRLLNEGIRDAKANNVSEIKTRFAMRFGTYTDKDMTPIIEVFRLLDQIAKELIGENK